jgi:hypothetical protein
LPSELKDPTAGAGETERERREKACLFQRRTGYPRQIDVAWVYGAAGILHSMIKALACLSSVPAFSPRLYCKDRLVTLITATTGVEF